MPPQTILLVEDEAELARVTSAFLRKAGFEVVTAADGRRALQFFDGCDPALVLLDLRLPELDGLEVARQLRNWSDVPIIMLTARVTEGDKLSGLRWADDYITKPFSYQELLARIHSVLRRARGSAPRPRLEIGTLAIDWEASGAVLRSEPLVLTRTEFELLSLLAQHPHRVFNRLQLFDHIKQTRGTLQDGDPRTVDTHIKNLRRKIEADPSNPQCVLTVYGMGYKFVPPP